MSDQKRFTRIVGLSDRIQLPRCGKVRLGEKRVNAAKKEYPVDLSYFKFDEEMLQRYPKIASVLGDRETGAIEPKELHIILPLEDEETIFPQSLRFYGRSRGLRCIGDGARAERSVCRKCRVFDCACDSPELEKQPQKCKCNLYDEGKCKEQASLMFVLPEITWEGCWQLDTGSYHNIVHINSAIAFVRGVLGRIALVPLTLRRIPVEITYQGKKRVHYLLSLGYDGDTETVRKLRVEMPSGAPALPRPTNYALPEPVLDGDDLPPVPDDEPMPDPEPPDGLAGDSQGRTAPRSDPSDQSDRSEPPPDDDPVSEAPRPITGKQLALIKKSAATLGLGLAGLRSYFPAGVANPEQLSSRQASDVIQRLLAELNKRPSPGTGHSAHPPAPAR